MYSKGNYQEYFLVDIYYLLLLTRLFLVFQYSWNPFNAVFTQFVCRAQKAKGRYAERMKSFGTKLTMFNTRKHTNKVKHKSTFWRVIALLANMYYITSFVRRTHNMFGTNNRSIYRKHRTTVCNELLSARATKMHFVCIV